MSAKGYPRHAGDRRPLKRVVRREYAKRATEATDGRTYETLIQVLMLECGHGAGARGCAPETKSVRCGQCPLKPLETGRGET